MITQTPNYPCDMHCHTLRSDGNDTPLELIENAAIAGLHALGITDHDIDPPLTVDLPDGRKADTVDYAAELGVILVPGYEFSCDSWVDDVHICGYRLDWSHPDLQAEIAAAKQSKSRAYEELCTVLTLNGMPVDWDADVLAGIRQPDEVQRKHIFEAMAARGHAETWSDAKILVRDNPDLNVRRRKIDPLGAVALINRCGGVSVLAHPYLIDEEIHLPDSPPMMRAQYIDRLIEAGLDGIEIRYTYDKTSYQGTLTPEQIEAEIRSAYTGRLRCFSGGSDYHAGHKKNTRQPRRLGERGLTIEEFEEFETTFG